MPPTPKGPAAAAGLLIPCVRSVERRECDVATGVPWNRVLRSEVWLSMVLSTLLSRRFFPKRRGRFRRMRGIPADRV